MNENQRTVTLPTIPKEVADVIERLRGGGVSTPEIITRTNASSPCGILRTIPSDTLLSALVNGYVVEKSTEELMREEYDNIRKEYVDRPHSWYYDGRADGIKFTLNTLGIKIEGVNA